MAALSTDTTVDRHNVAIDNSENIYVCSSYGVSTNEDTFLVKLAPDLTSVTWSYKAPGAFTIDGFQEILYDKLYDELLLTGHY